MPAEPGLPHAGCRRSIHSDVEGHNCEESVDDEAFRSDTRSRATVAMYRHGPKPRASFRRALWRIVKDTRLLPRGPSGRGRRGSSSVGFVVLNRRPRISAPLETHFTASDGPCRWHRS